MSDTFIFYSDDSSGIPTSSMHLASQLARKAPVYWFNTYTRMPRLTWNDFLKVSRFARKTIRPSVSARENDESSIIGRIPSCTPLMVPWFVTPIRAINGRLGLSFFHNFVQKKKVESPVLIATFPNSVDVFRKIGLEAKKIYYCVDEWSEMPGMDSKRFKIMEQEIFQTVDAAMFTSRDLMERKSGQTAKSLYLPHGVDYDHFVGPGREERPGNETSTLSLLRSLPKPIVGFFGIVDSWVDLEVISTLADRFTHCSFVLIGRYNVSTELLQNRPNVHLLDALPYSDLPKHANYFDVGLIPFVVNDLTKAVNPLKLMEYFALGLPVISTALPDIRDVAGPLYFARSREEFGDRLDEIFQADPNQLADSARETAKNNSWSARADLLMDFAGSLD